MEFANEMARLRGEIEQLRDMRMVLKRRLRRHALDLRKSMHDKRAAMRQSAMEQAAGFKASLSSFVSDCRRRMCEMMGQLQKERSAARRNWFSGDRPAGMRHS